MTYHTYSTGNGKWVIGFSRVIHQPRHLQMSPRIPGKPRCSNPRSFSGHYCISFMAKTINAAICSQSHHKLTIHSLLLKYHKASQVLVNDNKEILTRRKSMNPETTTDRNIPGPSGASDNSNSKRPKQIEQS